VHSLGLGHLLEREPAEQRELLQEHRRLAPRPRFAHGGAAEVVRNRRLERRLPRGEVVAGEKAALSGGELVNRLRHEAAVEQLARALELVLAGPAARLGDDPRVRRGETWITQPSARLRRGKVQLGGRRPPAEERLAPLDRHRDPGNDVVAQLRVADRVLQDVLEPHRPEVAQQRHPAVEGARHTGR
jgi:hypothetical protein